MTTYAEGLAVRLLRGMLADGDAVIHLHEDHTEIRDRLGRVLATLQLPLERTDFALVADPTGPAIVDQRASGSAPGTPDEQTYRERINRTPFWTPKITGPRSTVPEEYMGGDDGPWRVAGGSP